MINPVIFYKCLADETRLRTLTLIEIESELCVCEIACALDLSQPKISRHLAQLRQAGLLEDRRQGQWIYYRLHSELPKWCHDVLRITLDAQQPFLDPDRDRLAAMGDRPERKAACC